MKKLLSLLVLILTLCLCFASCGAPEAEKPDDGKEELTEWTVDAVYAKAQSMGYEGSLEDFIALVSGKDGKDGEDGTDGMNGKSAYEIAVESGYKGTASQWIESLTGTPGKDGDSAYDIAVKNGFEGTEVEWLATLVPMGGKYTVTFDLGYEDKKFTAESYNYKVAEPDTPSREGYSFLGWEYAEDNYSFPWLFPAYAVTEDMTLVATWSKINSGGDSESGVEDGPDRPQTDGIHYDYTWTLTDIIVKLTNSSNSGELSSGCKRYYAGQDSAAFDDIDKEVKTRNQLAQNAANVKVRYSYIEESDNKGWGASIYDIVVDVNSGAIDSPDIFCNFAYDMTCASLRGCFANLLKDADKTGKGRTNFFRFIEDDYSAVITNPEDYFNSDIGEGYFYQYMRSLSLTPDTKLYCLASDYTIDVMRSFLVMPVNVEVLNGIALADVGENHPIIKDWDGDCDHDIDDFYDLVWNGGWNYDALAAYAAAAYKPGSDTTKPNTDFSDTVVGLALGQGSSITSSGLLYTTSVKIFEKQADGSYAYPETNYALNDFVNKLYQLVNGGEQAGICVVNSEEGKTVVPTAKTEIEAIRSKFADGGVLFGGIVCVGNLEDWVYQAMYGDGGDGFGIVPVPKYKAEVEEYKTLVHNLARIVAISRTTTKFSQCSAFLDYQSRFSADVLNSYYDFYLTRAVSSGSVADNDEMLIYLRNHVNDCFDSTFEEIIANYANETDADAMNIRFHDYIMSQGYKVSAFFAVYDAVYSKKTDYLEDVLDAWADLE